MIYEHLGFTYSNWIDTEHDALGRPENRKIWHDVTFPDGKVVHGPWSPYEHPKKEQFEAFVERLLEEK